MVYQVATVAYISLQVALLIQWARPGVFRTKVSIAAAVFGLLDAFVILGLSLVEHSRSIRPSTLLQVYLLLSLLCDIVRARTLWLIGSEGAIASVFIAAVIVKFCVAFLESIEKRCLLITEYKSLTLESTSGVLNLSVFWWLNRLLRSGSRNIFTLDDLEDVKQEFHSDALQRSLEEFWSTCRLTSYLPLEIGICC
jgi:ATP-binding cassette subfamily C (CFTR/MRP) protein 1